MSQRRWITREEIAEIHKQRVRIAIREFSEFRITQEEVTNTIHEGLYAARNMRYIETMTSIGVNRR